MNEIFKYTCPRCGHKQYDIGEIWASGSFWTEMFRMNYKRFTHITCKNCRFTEIYKVPRKQIADIANFHGRQ